VSAYAPYQSDASSNKYDSNMLYRDKLLEFDLTIISNIRVESRYRNGISLNKDKRTVDLKLYSNVDFNVNVDNLND
jgi:hypothetical protein